MIRVSVHLELQCVWVMTKKQTNSSGVLPVKKLSFISRFGWNLLNKFLYTHRLALLWKGHSKDFYTFSFVLLMLSADSRLALFCDFRGGHNSPMSRYHPVASACPKLIISNCAFIAGNFVWNEKQFVSSRHISMERCWCYVRWGQKWGKWRYTSIGV